MRLFSSLACLALMFGGAGFSFADDKVDEATPAKAADTKENRLKAAQRYLKIMPMKDMMEDMAKEMSKTMPADQAAVFKKILTQDVDISVLEKAATESMVKNFTTSEIEALAKFYASPEGRSVMKKLGVYMADVMPAIQQEIARAAEKNK